METGLILKLSGIFLGVIGRAVVPWLRKLREGKLRSFGRRYLISALASLLLGAIVTLLVFPQFAARVEAMTLEAGLKLFCLAFGFGFGWHGIISEAAKWAGAFNETPLKGKIPPANPCCS